MTEWNDENEALLTKLWAEGLSAGKIAAQIPGATRNAVIGKAGRMNLPKHKKAQGKKPRVRPPKMRFPERTPAVVTVEFTPPAGPGIPFLESNEFTCRAVIGRGEDDLVLFCNNRKESDDSYCPFHASIYYNPLARRA